MLHQPLSRYASHHFVGMVHPLSTPVPKRKRECIGNLIRCGGAKVGRVGHGRTIAHNLEHVENIQHVLRLQNFCRLLAEEATGIPSLADQIDRNFIAMLECCAPLHDIGKVGLPDYILLKPGKLAPDERVIMQTHTTMGAAVLQKVARQHSFAATFLQMAVDIARHHHERYDGAGYPDRLAGSAIPLSARIVAIGDVYDALRSRRVYKPALSHQEALAVMTNTASVGQFDPLLFQVFMTNADGFDKMYTELQD